MCGCFVSKLEEFSGGERGFGGLGGGGGSMADKQDQKLRDAEKWIKKADKLTKLSFTRWAADWAEATPLYEQAGLAYKQAKMFEKAKHCFEKAATGQERLSSQWTAAKHLETAGGLAKELETWPEVADLYKRASELYMFCGKPQPAADALVRGAKAIEDAVPDEAIRMYLDSCSYLEDDGREQMAFDTYRAATSLYIKQQRYGDAATMLLRWGQAADKCKAVQSQCKAYVSAILVYLYNQDLKAAEQCYNDCSQIDAFLNSEQNQLAEKVLQAYRDSDGDEVQYIIKSSKTLPHLDHMIVRLAKQLPVGGLKPDLSTSNDDVDDNDLT
ncbi:hypothetical protein R1sor_027272 [Riccia sorocarpa]|uniref:Gamma-soluble NSF attachment protein n=1 Tax=Riccia sorocarpa TaxID=122646 RepID=A0ABD3GFW1_9MARC